MINPQPKPRKIRSKKIRNSAKGENCTLRIPGFCASDNSTVVLCHAPTFTKGTGNKSGDLWSFYGCQPCHLFADGGYVEHGWTREQIIAEIYRAVVETQYKLIQKGLIEII